MLVAMADAEADKRAEAEIEIWKVKKLVKNLEAARGCAAPTPCRDSLGGMHCAAWRGGDRAATDQLRPHRASLAGTARR